MLCGSDWQKRFEERSNGRPFDSTPFCFQNIAVLPAEKNRFHFFQKIGYISSKTAIA